MRVFIVDDESIVRRSLRRAFERLGHQVDEAADGREALEIWRLFRPQLVYLDVLMPRMSGPDLLKALSPTERACVKIVLMSAFAGEYDLEKAKSQGADLFIAKPFENVFAVAKLGEELVRE